MPADGCTRRHRGEAARRPDIRRPPGVRIALRRAAGGLLPAGVAARKRANPRGPGTGLPPAGQEVAARIGLRRDEVGDDITHRLRAAVTDPLKGQFVGREEVIDLIALAVVAGEHLFLFGPPGTAKSALIRAFATAVEGQYFEYLLTRFSEPNEVFGPIDLVKLREGTVATVTSGMLPEAEFAFLDELFNANSAILNNLLTVLNERLYRRGREVVRLPLLSLFSASNHLPEDDALGALFDRFLLRCRVEPLPRDYMGRLLEAGWALEKGPTGHLAERNGQ